MQAKCLLAQATKKAKADAIFFFVETKKKKKWKRI